MSLIEGIFKVFLAEVASLMFFALVAFARAGTILRSPAAGIGVGIALSIVESIIRPLFYSFGNPWSRSETVFPYGYAKALPKIWRSILQPRCLPVHIDRGSHAIHHRHGRVFRHRPRRRCCMWSTAGM